MARCVLGAHEGGAAAVERLAWPSAAGPAPPGGSAGLAAASDQRPATATRMPAVISCAPVLSFTTCLRRWPARSRSRSVVNESPVSTLISISLLGSSSLMKGMSTSSPGWATVAALPRSGSRIITRAVGLGGSTVTARWAGRHFSRRAMIASERERALGPDLDPLDETAAAGAAELDHVHAGPGDGDRLVVDVVAELALAVQVDVDVLGRRAEREGARRRRRGRRRRAQAASRLRDDARSAGRSRAPARGARRAAAAEPATFAASGGRRGGAGGVTTAAGVVSAARVGDAVATTGASATSGSG